MLLPKKKQELLNKIVIDLKQTDHILAVVLGGSYAMGKANENSDLDIGIYYSEKKPFKIEDIKSIAKKYSNDNNPTVTGFYEWGPWVNGGAWINTESGKVDFLYRSLEHVKLTIEKAKKGDWENHFEQQPPYGFSSIIYLAETEICIPLHDPDQIISQLKAEVQPYPAKLKESVLQYSLWPAEFSIWHADYFLKKKDIYNLVGCLARAVKNIVTALFAINEMYPLGDKRAIEILENAAKKPSNLKEKIDHILCINKETADTNVSLLKELFADTVEMTNGTYKAFYK
jgi:hypothetical protein